MKTKKKNPQDATLRNVRAAHAQLKRLALMLAKLSRRVDELERPTYGALSPAKVQRTK